MPELVECPSCHKQALKAKFCSECGVNMEERKAQDIAAERDQLKTRVTELETELTNEKAKNAAHPPAGDPPAGDPPKRKQRGPFNG